MEELTRENLFFLEFERRRDGMLYAMNGGLWLHRHVWKGKAMAHLVSTDRERLVAWGRLAGLSETRLQYKPLKDPRTSQRRHAWHWDLFGRLLPPRSPFPTPPLHGGKKVTDRAGNTECSTA
jgi:hypothetical protein